MSNKKSRLAIALAAALAVSVFSGCAQPQSSASFDRETVYESAADMSEDSNLVAIGTVAQSRQATDIPDSEAVFTISEFEIVEVLKTSVQGSLNAGDTIEVRQFGADGSESDPPPVALLQTGETYLLFLTSSGLEGDLASHFYVTGASAGLYEPLQDVDKGNLSNLENLEFQQVEPSEEEPALRLVSPSDVR